jgi:1-acyl-sn-glycerol-3-phosphate acyltransferase
MRKITGYLGYAYKLYFGLWFYLTLLLLYPFFRIAMLRQKWFIAAFRLKQFWAVLLQIGGFYWLHVSGKDQRKKVKGPVIYVSNHCSYLDIVFMYRLARHKFIFMGKDSLLKWPLFGDFFRFMDIPVDRKNKASAARALIKAKRYIENGWSIAIFPEGTIPDSAPVMIPFREGAFRLAADTGVPIQPITWTNNHGLFSDPSKITGPAHPGVVRAILHPAVLVSEKQKSVSDLSAELHQIISGPLRSLYPDLYLKNDNAE